MNAPLSQTTDELREQLRHYTDEQALLLEITQRIARGGPLGPMLQDVAQMAQRGLKADSLRVVLGKPQMVQAVYTAGSAADNLAALDAPLFGYVAANGSLERADVHREKLPVTGKLPSGSPGLGALLAVPLVAHETQYGMLWVGYIGAHPFSDWERNFLALVAGQTAVASANASAFEAARKGREQVAAILSSSVDPILVIDSHEVILVLNPAAEGALSVAANQAIGSRLDQVAGLNDAEPLLALLRSPAQGGEGMEWQNDSGQVFAPRVSEMHDEQGHLSGRVLVLRDITRYKNLRENQADFVSTVSHDLRSPLTYMSGYIDMLPMVGDLNEKQSGFFEKIANGVMHMRDLVEKILDASRLDPEGNYQLHREPCDVAKLVNEVVNTHLPPAEKKSLRFTAEIAPGLPVLNLDEMMVKRALNNLTDNAIKYTPEGGQIVVQAGIEDNNLVLSVQDNGLGITPENQKILFERFRRVRRREFQQIKGSGLGLYVVRRVAELHGGKASVVSMEQQGSQFFIRLPMDGPNLVGSKPKEG